MTGFLLGLVFAAGVAFLFLHVTGVRVPMPTSALRIDTLLDDAGLAASPGAVLGGIGACGLLAAVLVWWIVDVPAVIIAGAIGAVVAPIAWLRSRRENLRRERERAWPAVLGQLADALEAGLAFPAAVGLVADSGPTALRGDFAAFRARLRGSDLTSALDGLRRPGERTTDSVALLLRAALLELPTGGLAPVLRELAGVLSERLEAREKARSRTASLGMEAAILALSPIVILLLIGVSSPGFLAAYRTTAGTVVSLLCGVLIFGCYLLMRRLGQVPEPRSTRIGEQPMNAALLFSSLCLVVGGLLLCEYVLSRRRPALSTRLAAAQGARQLVQGAGNVSGSLPEPVRAWIEKISASYDARLHRAGNKDSVGLFFAKKALLAFAVPFIPLTPYATLARQLPPGIVVLVLAVLGFFLPDLSLRVETKKRREALFLDLPEALAVMTLSLKAGQSLRQALELAARDCEGVLGDELTNALSLARRDRTLSERDALVVVARESNEPMFLRFAELLAAKESPYGEFLRGQAREMRAEQNRYLERAADRAHLAMHLPLAPLIAVVVLWVSFGFLHLLAQTI